MFQYLYAIAKTINSSSFALPSILPLKCVYFCVALFRQDSFLGVHCESYPYIIKWERGGGECEGDRGRGGGGRRDWEEGEEVEGEGQSNRSSLLLSFISCRKRGELSHPLATDRPLHSLASTFNPNIFSRRSSHRSQSLRGSWNFRLENHLTYMVWIQPLFITVIHWMASLTPFSLFVFVFEERLAVHSTWE